MKKYCSLLILLLSSFILFSQAETSLALGRKQYQDENYAQALDYITKAATEEPNNPQVPYLSGHVYLDMNNYKQAAAFLEKAISMDSAHSNWIYECGLVYYTIADYKKSLQFMELAGVKGYKKTSDYMENLANVYVKTKQYNKAIEIYKEIILKKPSDQEIMYQLAQVYFNATKYQEAIDTWDKVLTLDKTNAGALYMIGLSYQKKGETAKGQQLCDKAIEMDPSLASRKKSMGGNF